VTEILEGRKEAPVAGEALVPKEAFISPEFAALETERLWARVWQVACREEEVANVGDFVEYKIADQSIVVVRADETTIRAYFNACLHRGTPLKYGCGNAKEFRCRYHAWRWNLDGSIKEVLDGFDFDPKVVTPESLQLPECAVATWGGFVFINMDRDAQRLYEFLRPVAQDLDRFELEQMRIEKSRTAVLAANWKTALFAFTDNYHGSGTHPQLMFYNDDTGWPYETFGTLGHGRFEQPVASLGRPSKRLGDFPYDAKQIALARIADAGETGMYTEEFAAAVREMAEAMPDDMSASDFLASVRRRQAAEEGLDLSRFSNSDIVGTPADWLIFPNISTPLNAVSEVFIRFRPNGTDPESCLVDVWNLRRFADGDGPKSVERQYFDDWRDHDGWGRILSQDFDNIPKVQRGMHSRRFEHLICGRQDLLMWNHMQVLNDYYINA